MNQDFIKTIMAPLLNHHYVPLGVRTRQMRHELHGVLTRYVRLQVAHALGMLGMFSRQRLRRKPLVSDHGTCIMHVPWCMSGSLTCGGSENFAGIPGTWAAHNFTYLLRLIHWNCFSKKKFEVHFLEQFCFKFKSLKFLWSLCSWVSN